MRSVPGRIRCAPRGQPGGLCGQPTPARRTGLSVPALSRAWGIEVYKIITGADSPGVLPPSLRSVANVHSGHPGTDRARPGAGAVAGVEGVQLVRQALSQGVLYGQSALAALGLDLSRASPPRRPTR